MADISISLDETLELDTIIKESSIAQNPINNITYSGSNSKDYNMKGIETHTSVFDPQQSGTYTIDINGQELSVEVTDTSTIPDSVVHQYNAKQLTGYTDGDSVGTRSDQSGSVDVTGNGGYRANSLNGYPTVDYDGLNDRHSVSANSISTKYVVFAVISPDFSSSTSNDYAVWSSNAPVFVWRSGVSSWTLYGGNTDIYGSSTVEDAVMTAVVNGSNSIIRENGTETASGNAGSSDFGDVQIGFNNRKNERNFDGDIPFIEIHNGNVSNGLQTREQKIADMWSITI